MFAERVVNHPLNPPPIADIVAACNGTQMKAREAAMLTFSGISLQSSLIVAVLVGMAIYLINQGTEMLGGRPVLWKLLLYLCSAFSGCELRNLLSA